MTAIKAWMGLKFSKIENGSSELAALERLKKISIYLKWEKCCEHTSAFIFGWIFFIAGIKDNYESLVEFDFRPHLPTNYRVSCPWVSKI